MEQGKLFLKVNLAAQSANNNHIATPMEMVKKQKLANQTVILVDENDNFLGYAPRHKAHEGKGLRHRAFVCFVINKKGEVLLQRRKHWLWDNFWDVSAISHPLHLNGRDETYEEAASRALKHEMGIEGVAPKKVGAFTYFISHDKDNGCENEYCAILFGNYDGEVKPDEEDAYGYRWIKFSEFVEDVEHNEHLYTPWVKLMLETLEKENNISNFLEIPGKK